MTVSESSPEDARTSDPAMAYLKTALLVDDRAYEGPNGSAPLELVDPAGLDPDADDDFISASQNQTEPVRPVEPVDNDRVDTKIVVDAFAAKGVACAVLAPQEGQQVGDSSVVELAANADIVVFDWVLRARRWNEANDPLISSGADTTSRPFIRALLERDASERRGIRLICIYTGDADLEKVVTDVRAVAVEVFGAERVTRFTNEMCLRVEENVLFLFYRKPARGGSYVRPADDPVMQATDAPVELVGAPIDAADLVNRLCQDFREFINSSLLRRLAIAALASVRQDMPRLLARFDSDLDRPFLSHWVLTEPEAAIEWALTLVGDELASVASQGVARTALDSAHMLSILRQYWPEGESRSIPKERFKSASVSMDRGVMEGLVRHGRERGSNGAPTNVTKALKQVPSITVALFDESPTVTTTAAAQDDKLAVLSCLDRDPTFESARAPAPHLTLGTLLMLPQQDSAPAQAYLCVQPRCDSVRLEGESKFPLLELELRSPEETPWDFTVRATNGTNFLRLAFPKSPMAHLELPSFAPIEGRIEAARSTDGQWIFQSSGEQDFVWLGDLRADQALRASSSLSSSASRIGLNEYEYQRLVARRR